MQGTLAFFSIGGSEILFIFLAVRMLFGSDKIPEIARGLGKAVKQVRNATDDNKREINSTVATSRPENPMNTLMDTKEEIENLVEGSVKRGGSTKK